MLAAAPEQWGGWYWAHCPHPTCYWVHRAETLLNAQAALSNHRAEAHRD